MIPFWESSVNLCTQDYACFMVAVTDYVIWLVLVRNLFR